MLLLIQYFGSLTETQCCAWSLWENGGGTRYSTANPPTIPRGALSRSSWPYQRFTVSIAIIPSKVYTYTGYLQMIDLLLSDKVSNYLIHALLLLFCAEEVDGIQDDICETLAFLPLLSPSWILLADLLACLAFSAKAEVLWKASCGGPFVHTWYIHNTYIHTYSL